MKINVKKVKNYEFDGYVNIEDLSDAQLFVLGIDRETHLSEQIEVIGAFDVYCDDCDGYVDQIEYVTIIGALTGTSHYGYTGKSDRTVGAFGMTTVTPIWGDVPDTHVIELSDSEYDVDNLCEQILDHSDTSEWYQDKMEHAADMAYESMRDEE